jgi:predicted transcriptional regulator
VKTAISIPDNIFSDAERLARALRKSRSQLYSQALREYLARHAPDEVTDGLDRAWSDASPDEHEFATRAAKHTPRRWRRMSVRNAATFRSRTRASASSPMYA